MLRQAIGKINKQSNPKILSNKYKIYSVLRNPKNNSLIHCVAFSINSYFIKRK